MKYKAIKNENFTFFVMYGKKNKVVNKKLQFVIKYHYIEDNVRKTDTQIIKIKKGKLSFRPRSISLKNAENKTIKEWRDVNHKSNVYVAGKEEVFKCKDSSESGVFTIDLEEK